MLKEFTGEEAVNGTGIFFVMINDEPSAANKARNEQKKEDLEYRRMREALQA